MDVHAKRKLLWRNPCAIYTQISAQSMYIQTRTISIKQLKSREARNCFFAINAIHKLISSIQVQANGGFIQTKKQMRLVALAFLGGKRFSEANFQHPKPQTDSARSAGDFFFIKHDFASYTRTNCKHPCTRAQNSKDPCATLQSNGIRVQPNVRTPF